MEKIFCLIAVFILSAQLAVAGDEELKKFDTWVVLKGQEKGKNYCYAINTPFETRAYYSPIERTPYLLIVYVKPGRFTIGIDNGYTLDQNKGVFVTVGNRKRMLEVLAMYRNAITYSSVEDVALINDIMESESVVTVESFGTENYKAVDYYSMKPVKQLLNYMQKNCN